MTNLLASAAAAHRAHRLRLNQQVARKLRALIDSGVDPADASSMVLDEIVNDPINAELDWVELLPFIMELIAMLLMIFARRKP